MAKAKLWFEDQFKKMKKLISAEQVPAAVAGETPLNLSETSQDLILRAELPGFTEEEISVKLWKDRIEISAEKKSENVEQKKGFYARQVSAGSVRKFQTLPMEVDPNKASKKFENNILEIRMPKAKKGFTRTVKPA